MRLVRGVVNENSLIDGKQGPIGIQIDARRYIFRSIRDLKHRHPTQRELMMWKASAQGPGSGLC